MNTRLIIAGVLLAGGGVLSRAAAQAPDAKTLYQENCRKCHGVLGTPPKTMKAKFPKIATFDAEFIAKHQSKAAFLGYRGFPASVCISINDQVVHGIPGPRVIQQGDIVSIDIGVVLDGYYSDTAWSYYADGEMPEPVSRLMSLLFGLYRYTAPRDEL